MKTLFFFLGFSNDPLSRKNEESKGKKTVFFSSSKIDGSKHKGK